MELQVQIANYQKKYRLSQDQIKETIKTTLTNERIPKALLSIVFVSDSKIRSLNKTYLRKNRATDVLAFDLGECPLSKGKKTKCINGEIVISVDTAYKNARRFKTTLKNELTLYLIHGILHLSGYDDHRAIDKKKMRQKEQALLQKVNS